MGEQQILSESEKKKLANFVNVAIEMKNEGYSEKESTIAKVPANVLSIVLVLPLVAIIGVPYVMRNGLAPTSKAAGLLAVILCLVVLIAELMAREGIRTLTWGLIAPGGFSVPKIGFAELRMTPYCYCGKPIPRSIYIIGSFMPTIILGIVQGIVAIMTGSLFIFFLAIIMIFAGGRDNMICFLMIRYRKSSSTLLVMDHPTKTGFEAFEKD